MEGEEPVPDLELVKAAMMEELGIGRKDTLPLEDRGHRNIGNVPRPAVPRTRESKNPWQSVVFDDVDEAELQLDNIADGQLYRDRRVNGGAHVGRGGSSRGGHRGSHRGGNGAGRGGHAADNSGGGRGGHTSSPGKQASTKGSSSTPFIPKGPKSQGRGGHIYDFRRHGDKSARVEATIARLRGPSSYAGASRTNRVPAKSAFGSGLVSTEEFYAYASIQPSSATRLNPTSQSVAQVSQVNQRSTQAVESHPVLNKAQTLPEHTVAVKTPLANTPMKASNTIQAGNKKSQPTSALTPATLKDKKKPTAVTEHKIQPTTTLISDEKHSNSATVNLGQGGLAGSRWAEPLAAGVSSAKASALPVSQPPIIIKSSVAPVANSSDRTVVQAAAPSVATIDRSHAQNEAVVASTAIYADAFPVSNTALQVILWNADGVKISNSLISEVCGSIRFVTDPESNFAILQAAINGMAILDEPLYSTDMFDHEEGSIIFQAYSETGDGPRWKLQCPLPYQSAMVVIMMKKRVMSMTRPIQRQPKAVLSSVSPVGENPTVQGPSNQQAGLGSAVAPAAGPNPPTQKNELLIDFDAEEERPPLSATFQVLMSLMTDDRSIADFVERLDGAHDDGFLDQIFSVTGYPPPEGYSHQMLLAARTLVAQLYTQSDIFQKLPPDVAEPIAHETSVRVLEKALSIWRAGRAEAPQPSRTDGELSSNPIPRLGVYPPDTLMSLRDHSSTIEGKLISDECYEGKKEGTTPIMGVSHSEGARRIIPVIHRLPIASTTDASVPPTEYLASAIESAAPSADPANVSSTGIPMPPVTENPEHLKQLTPSRAGSTQPAETLLSPELDIKSESSDSELSSKLRALTLANTPTITKSICYPVSTYNNGGVPTEPTTKVGNTNQSTLQISSATPPQPAPVPEISNTDLKGNPGLAASRWAQPTGKPAVQKPATNRTPRSTTSFVQPPPFDPRTSSQPSTLDMHHPNPAGLGQPQYPFAPAAYMPQQPFNVPQPHVPQLTTILVTDPHTGEVREVTGVTKVAQPIAQSVMYLPGRYPMHHGPPTAPVPAAFPGSPVINNPQVEGKSHEPGLLRAGAQTFSPGGETRPPLSPTRRQNTQVQAKKYTDASPFF